MRSMEENIFSFISINCELVGRKPFIKKDLKSNSSSNINYISI